jgi:hypothetical protein
LIYVFALLSGIIILLALAERFGGPVAPKTFQIFGKTKLIDNSASLLARPQLAPEIADDYVKMTIARASKALHAPKNLSDAELRAFLIRAGENKKVQGHLNLLLARIEMAKASKIHHELLSSVRQIYHWFKEL